MAVHHQKRLFLEFPFFFHSEIHLSTRKFQKVHSRSLAPLLCAAYMEDRVCLLINYQSFNLSRMIQRIQERLDIQFLRYQILTESFHLIFLFVMQRIHAAGNRTIGTGYRIPAPLWNPPCNLCRLQGGFHRGAG